MSARERLFGALWDNYTPAQKNVFISEFAAEVVAARPLTCDYDCSACHAHEEEKD